MIALKIKQLANIYLVLALVLGAMVPIMLKIATQNINLYEYVMLTYLVAMPTSFLFILFRKKTDRLKESMGNIKEFLLIAMLGFLGYGFFEYGLTYAEQFISTSLATVVYRTSPLLMLLFLPFVLKEKVSKYQIAALMLGLAGLYIALTGGNLTSIFSNANALIIGLVILLALSNALYGVLIKKYSFDMEIAVFIFNFSIFIFAAFLFFATGAKFQALNADTLIAIFYVGIVYNVIVGIMYSGALRMAKTTIVTNIYFLSPFITFLFSWLILGEQIYFYYIAIALLVAAGLLIQKFDRKGGSYMAKDKKAHPTLHDVTSAFVHTSAPEIYTAIKSGGRVLAIKVDKDYYSALNSIKRRWNSEKRAVVVYFNTEKKFINKEEDNFVRDVMGAKENDIVVMSAGNTKESEDVLSEMADSAK